MAGLDRDRRAEHLERAEAASPERDRPEVNRRAGQLLDARAAREDERHGTLAGRAEHVLGERVVDHLGERISSSLSGARRQAFGLREPLENAFAATLASVEDEIPCSPM